MPKIETNILDKYIISRLKCLSIGTLIITWVLIFNITNPPNFREILQTFLILGLWQLISHIDTKRNNEETIIFDIITIGIAIWKIGELLL